jgi:hypothetical protein
MTRTDIENLAQVPRFVRSVISREDFDRLLDRLLWAIHASADTPQFDEDRFRASTQNDGVSVFD